MTARLTRVLLVAVPAAMAQPWQTPVERWVLGVAIAVVVIVLAWWRGQFVTTMAGRRLAVWRRNRRAPTHQPFNEVAVLLSVVAPAGAAMPLQVVESYVERYGVRCTKVRVTNLDTAGTRRTWIGMTLNAVDNLAALQARSPGLPLYETAEIVGRRLSDHLRELGFEATIVDEVEGPTTAPSARARETWRGIADEDGHLAAYATKVDDTLPERLEQMWTNTDQPTWTALEFGGTAARPTLVAMAAVRSAEAPQGPPVGGLLPQNGRHRPVLTALDPRSVQVLAVPPAALPAGMLDRLHWPVGTPLPRRACVSAGDTPGENPSLRTLAG